MRRQNFGDLAAATAATIVCFALFSAGPMAAEFFDRQKTKHLVEHTIHEFNLSQSL
jgi:hypothetical protein